MKTIIAGSRSIRDQAYVYQCIDIAQELLNFDITEIISGHARGADKLGEQYGLTNNIPVKRFVPDWERHPTIGGLKRNEEMAAVGDVLIAIWDGKSTGTGHMIRVMEEAGKQVVVFMPDGRQEVKNTPPISGVRTDGVVPRGNEND